MLPSNSALHQQSPAQAQSPAHSEPFNISIRSQQPPSSFSNPFLGNQGQFSPTILIEAGRAHDHPHQQPASSSSSFNNNGPTIIPSNISSTPLQSIEFNANSNNGFHCDGSSQSSSFSHGISVPPLTPLRRSARLERITTSTNFLCTRRITNSTTILCTSAPSTALRRAYTDPIISSSTPTSVPSCHQPSSSASTPRHVFLNRIRLTSSSSSSSTSSTAVLRQPSSLFRPGRHTRTPSSTVPDQHCLQSSSKSTAVPRQPSCTTGFLTWESSSTVADQLPTSFLQPDSTFPRVHPVYVPTRTSSQPSIPPSRTSHPVSSLIIQGWVSIPSRSSRSSSTRHTSSHSALSFKHRVFFIPVSLCYLRTSSGAQPPTTGARTTS